MKKVSRIDEIRLTHSVQEYTEKLNVMREALNNIHEANAQPEMKALMGKCFVERGNKSTVLNKKDHTETKNIPYLVFYKVIGVEYNTPGNHHLKVLQISKQPSFYGGFDYIFQVNNFYQSVIGNEQISSTFFDVTFSLYLKQLEDWGSK